MHICYLRAVRRKIQHGCPCGPGAWKRPRCSALLLRPSVGWSLPLMPQSAAGASGILKSTFTEERRLSPTPTSPGLSSAPTELPPYLTPRLPTRPLSPRPEQLYLRAHVQQLPSAKILQCSARQQPYISFMPAQGSLLLTLICAEEGFC